MSSDELDAIEDLLYSGLLAPREESAMDAALDRAVLELAKEESE
jgi:hypothetical protein